MFDRRYSLNGWDVAVLFGALAVLAVLNVVQLLPVENGTPVAAEADVPVQDWPLSGDMLRDYQAWQGRDSAIGVFARGATAYGWVEGYQDEAVARTDALTWCGRNGSDCAVIAVRDGLQAVEGFGVPLTERLVPVMARVRAMPAPVALAVSGTGAYGIGRGQTQNGAAANARAICTSAGRRDRPTFLPTHSCKVIYSR